MSAAAAQRMLVDADALIAQAKEVLASGRDFASGELETMRAALWHLAQRDRLGHDMLIAVVTEIERRAGERAQNAAIASTTSAISALVEHERRRPERWAALSPIQRAAFIMNDGTDLGRAFAKFAALVEDEETAQLAPPVNFEPPSRGY